MDRARIIIIAILLALLGIAIPLSATLYLSSLRATQWEEDRLHFFAQRALERANLSLDNASTALKELNRKQFSPCSAEHVHKMWLTTITTHSVDDIGYFENGKMKCNSTGLLVTNLSLQPAHFHAGNDMAFSLTQSHLLNDDRTMIGLSYQSHKALIDPSRFADIILDRDMQLAVSLANGNVLGMMHNPDLNIIRKMIAAPTTQDESRLYAVVRQGDLVAVTSEPRSTINAQLQREMIVLLPLGILMAAFMVGMVVWFLRRRLSPLGELKIAVERKEFLVHYQPIVSLKNGRCIGAEALVRWQRSDGSMTRPDLFIPLAEESGLIMKITDQVLDTLIRELKSLLNAEPGLHIAVNLSAPDIKSERMPGILQQKLHGTGIRSDQIWLEATERGFVDIKAARSTIAAVRAMGHMVAIDDFGTGYSSLSYLQGLPLDALKIDKSFVDTIGTDSATSSVTTHIIDIAKTLHLTIIAEGVETQEQADYLLARDVDFGQGWLFAKAMPAEEFIAFYRKSQQ